ncbi:unnamed protein product [Protopolystoma xenopodis]|uniref:UBZ4-type domain-containing protein n=1 Tax=Protopolystoma xenopodis TaxID=117903 RepID=A0A3S5AIS1_9PLAT|nr:unnamed protein product [Protopolystoma xenopodis]
MTQVMLSSVQLRCRSDHDKAILRGAHLRLESDSSPPSIEPVPMRSSSSPLTDLNSQLSRNCGLGEHLSTGQRTNMLTCPICACHMQRSLFLEHVKFCESNNYSLSCAATVSTPQSTTKTMKFDPNYLGDLALTGLLALGAVLMLIVFHR